MDPKDFFRKIADQSKLKNLYQEEVSELAKVVLEKWVINCSNYAAEGKYSAPLYAFTMDSEYMEIKISHLVKNGLLDYLAAHTKLDITFKEYIVNNDGKIYTEINNDVLDFGSFLHQDKKTIAHIGVIYANF